MSTIGMIVALAAAGLIGWFIGGSNAYYTGYEEGYDDGWNLSERNREREAQKK